MSPRLQKESGKHRIRLEKFCFLAVHKGPHPSAARDLQAQEPSLRQSHLSCDPVGRAAPRQFMQVCFLHHIFPQGFRLSGISFHGLADHLKASEGIDSRSGKLQADLGQRLVGITAAAQEIRPPRLPGIVRKSISHFLCGDSVAVPFCRHLDLHRVCIGPAELLFCRGIRKRRVVHAGKQNSCLTASRLLRIFQENRFLCVADLEADASFVILQDLDPLFSAGSVRESPSGKGKRVSLEFLQG